MIRKLFFAALVLIFALPAFAKQVDVETAKNVARTFWTQNLGKHTRSPFSNVTPQTEFTKFYILNTGDGFVIVAADDIASPILGYSDAGNFDPQNIPVNMLGWFRGYENEISQGISNGITASAEIATNWEKLSNGQGIPQKRSRSVNPLIQTRWNQGAPYNNLCPYDNDAQAHAVTGCVATVMAQIMKYWNYPTNGTGSHSYNHPIYGTLSADFGNTTYDWNNMPNALYNASSAQSTAVATLMYHCGVAVEMWYSVEASAAYILSLGNPDTYCAENALKNFFGYSTSIQGLEKSDYSDNDWKNILKAELDAGRPTMYSGWDPVDGRHEFICDGYNSNDYFHFNWGWGGYMDGFFTLDALTPGNGIDDVNVNFTSDQNALIGIEPNAGLFAIPNALTFSGVGESKTFMVRSSTSSQQWSATSNQTWLTVSPTTGEGNVTFATVTATATRNTTDSERTATIIITQGSETATVTVVQPSGIPNVPGCFGETDEYNSLIDLDSSMVVICSEGFGSYTTGHQVTSVKFTTIDPESNPWVNEYNNNSFTIKIYENGSAESGLGTLVYSQDYTQTHYGENEATLDTPYTINEATNFWIAVMANGPSLFRGNLNEHGTIPADEYNGSSEAFEGKYLYFGSEAGPWYDLTSYEYTDEDSTAIQLYDFDNLLSFCTINPELLLVNPSSLNFEQSGGNLNFTVKANNNVAENWTAVSSADWLTLSATSGEGNGAITTVTATAEENTTGSNRYATITVTHGSETKVINVVSEGRYVSFDFYLNLTVNDTSLGYLPDFSGWYNDFADYFNPNPYSEMGSYEYYENIFPITTDLQLTDIPEDDLFNHYHVLKVNPYPNARFLGWNSNIGIDHDYAFSNIKELLKVSVTNPIDTVNIEALFAPVHNGDTLHYCNNTNWNTNGTRERCRFTDTTTYYRWGVKFDPSALVGVTQIPQIEALLDPYSDQSNFIPCTYNIQLWQGGDDSPQTLIHTHTYTEDGNHNSVWSLIRFNSPIAIDNTQPLWVIISTTVPVVNVGWTPLYTRDYCGNPNSNYIWTSETGWTHYKKNYSLTQNGIQQFDPEVNNFNEVQNSWAIRVYTAIPTGFHVDTEVAGWNGAEIGDDHVIGGGAYNAGSNVTLTAVPDSGHAFVYWLWRNGDDSTAEWQQVSDNPVTFTVNRNVLYMAYFADTASLNVREVTTEIAGWNGTEIGDDHVIGGGTYAVGSSVTLTAVPDSGHCFKYWQWRSSDIPNAEWQRVNDNPVTFTIDGDVTYKAYFADNAYIQIRTNNFSLGRVHGSWSDYTSEYLAVGSTATITAEPINNGVFRRWEWYYECNPSVVYQTTENPYTFTIESDAKYTAYFEEIGRPVVTVNVNDMRMGSAWGGGGFEPGSTAVLTAMAVEGCIFTHWEWYYDSEPATVYQTTENPVIFTVERSVTYTAFFEPGTTVTSCHVSVRSNNNAWGTVAVNGNSSGDFQTGETAVLSATPNNGYQFAYWVLEEEGMMYPQYNPLYFEIYPGMEGNYSFTGYFEPISGIDDNTDDDIVIYSLDGCIIVEGADGETVTIYDMTGRIVRDCGLPNGVYMVKVGDRTPRKVVVAR